MKVLLVLSVSVWLVCGEPPLAPPPQQYLPSSQYGAPDSQYGPPQQGGYPGSAGQRPGGSSYDDGPSEPANYQFQYHVEDAPSGNDFGHEEERQGDIARGRYFVVLPDGRRQIVEYTADQDGYHPKVSYEGGQAGGQGGYPGTQGGYPGSQGGYPGGQGQGGYPGAQGQAGQGYNYWDAKG